MVQEAADLVKKRKADMIARHQKRIAQLESLRILVQKKEEEVRWFVWQQLIPSLMTNS